MAAPSDNLSIGHLTDLIGMLEIDEDPFRNPPSPRRAQTAPLPSLPRRVEERAVSAAPARSQAPSLAPTPKRGEIQGRRVFRYQKDVTAQSDDDVLKPLTEALKKVDGIYDENGERTAEGEFKTKIRKRFQHLHQRRAAIGLVVSKHERWKLELVTVANAMKASKVRAREQQTYTPLMTDPKKIALAFSSILRLEFLPRPLKRKACEVLVVLESDEHRNVLDFYKQKIKKCEEIVKYWLANNRVSYLVDLFSEVNAKFAEIEKKLQGKPQKAVHETFLLFEETYKFIQYTAQSFDISNCDEQHKGLHQGLRPSLEARLAALLLLSVREYCQAKKEECKGLLNKPEIQEKVKALWTLYRDVEQKMADFAQALQGKPDQTVVDTKKMLEELLTTIQSASRVVAPDTAKCDAAHRRLYTEVAGALEKKIEEFENFPPKASAEEKKEAEDPQRPENRYIASLPKVGLPDENHFRTGQWFTSLPLVGYPEIATEVAELTKVAAALYTMTETLEARIKALCKGNVKAAEGFESLDREKEYYDLLINGFERLIDVQRRALLKKPLSTQIHTGFYYVASLLADAKNVRIYIEQFERIALGKFRPYSLALSKLFDYLSPQDKKVAESKDYLTSLDAVSRLAKAITAVLPLKKPLLANSWIRRVRIRTYETIEETLAKVGLRSLELTEDEDKVPEMILARTTLANMYDKGENQLLPEKVRSYLMKGWLKYLHFSDGEIDPVFELILCIIHDDPKYKQAFFATLVCFTEDFQALFNAYQKERKFADDLPELQMMANLHLHSHRPESEHPAVSFVHFCQAMQLLCDIGNPRQQHLQWITKNVLPKLRSLETRLKLPPFCSKLAELPTMKRPLDQNEKATFPQIFYKLLVTSFFAHDEKVREETTEALHRIIGLLQAHELPRDGYIGMLLLRWILKDAILGNNFEKFFPQEHALLTELMKGYVLDPDLRELWREQFDVGFMEIALRLVVKREHLRQQMLGETPIVFQALQTSRGEQNLDEWLKVLRLYHEFLKIIATEKVLLDRSPAYIQAETLLGGVVEAFGRIPCDEPDPSLVDLDSNLGIARWCYRRMKAHIDAKRTFKS